MCRDTIIYSAVCPRLGGRTIAVKVYNKEKVSASKLRAIKREIAMMIFFGRKKVPNVVEFYGAFQDDLHYYIMMEHCPGGDLLEYMLKDKKAMSEKKTAAFIAQPLLVTLSHMHALHIIHRDIKLENIFLDAVGRVRLGDFGLTMSMQQEAAISPVGTVEYMAPEVVALPPVDHVTSGRIRASSIMPTNEKVDIWALGVTIFELVTGRLPFEGRDKAEMKAAISDYNLAAFPSHTSSTCQSIIRSMLSYDQSQRPSAECLLQHPYILTHLVTHGQSPPVMAPVVSLHARAGLQADKDAMSRSPNFPIHMSASSREISMSSTCLHRWTTNSNSSFTLNRGSSPCKHLASKSLSFSTGSKVQKESIQVRGHSHGVPHDEGPTMTANPSTRECSGVKKVIRRLFSRQPAPKSSMEVDNAVN